MDVEVEDVEAELWVDWLGRRRGGAAGRARRSAAELAVAMERSERVEVTSEASTRCGATCGRRGS